MTLPPGSPKGSSGGGGYTPPTTGPVTSKEIYFLLRQKGYSSIQAIGIMANMINESGLDPEAVAPGGASYGLVQMTPGSYPGASNLVTGNPQKDVRAQINSLAHYVSPRSGAVAGNSPAEVAGNFASRFEKCAGCQPGQQQWNGRRGNAATVAQWVAKGHWPTGTVRGGANNPGGNPPGGTPQCPDTCVTCNFPHTSWCPFHKTQARALIGGLLMGVGGLGAVVGLAVLVAGSFSKTKAGQAAGGVAGKVTEGVGAGLLLVPGAEGAGAGMIAASKGMKSGAQHVSKKRSAKRAAGAREDAELERRVGQPRENPDLRVGRGAIRETPAETRRRRSSRQVAATQNGGEKVPF